MALGGIWKAFQVVSLVRICLLGCLVRNFVKSLVFKVVDSCWISSTEWSDTFRSFFVYGKKEESRKKIHHNRAKKFHLPEEV